MAPVSTQYPRVFEIVAGGDGAVTRWQRILRFLNAANVLGVANNEIFSTSGVNFVCKLHIIRYTCYSGIVEFPMVTETKWITLLRKLNFHPGRNTASIHILYNVCLHYLHASDAFFSVTSRCTFSYYPWMSICAHAPHSKPHSFDIAATS